MDKPIALPLHMHVGNNWTLIRTSAQKKGFLVLREDIQIHLQVGNKVPNSYSKIMPITHYIILLVPGC